MRSWAHPFPFSFLPHGRIAMFDVIERLKADWTDKYVVIDSLAPELARFARTTGQVRTVNMNGRCLVEFDQYNNTGWYDIDPSCLKIVPKPLPKPAELKEKAAKPTAKAAAPAAKPAAKLAAKPASARRNLRLPTSWPPPAARPPRRPRPRQRPPPSPRRWLNPPWPRSRPQFRTKLRRRRSRPAASRPPPRIRSPGAGPPTPRADASPGPPTTFSPTVQFAGERSCSGFRLLLSVSR